MKKLKTRYYIGIPIITSFSDDICTTISRKNIENVRISNLHIKCL